MKKTLSESSIVRSVALAACERIARKTIFALQRMNYCLLAGDDSGLSSTWEEICVQIQGQEAFTWDVYEDTVRDLITMEFGKLGAHEQDAVWLQTDNGESWSLEDEDRRNADPVTVEDSIDFVLKDFILQKAAEWSNQRITRYLEECSKRD